MSAAGDIGELLQGTDTNSLDDVKQLILESLKSTKDAWFVHGLVDFYTQAQSKHALDILFQVSEPHDKQILDRLCELMKGTSRLQALMLCGHLVHKQVPWIYNIAKHNIFPYIIKIMKEATDVPILMSAVLLITSVLPMIPVAVKEYLHDIFDGFSRLAKFNLIKPVNVPDVYLIHLQVGVYSMFHRLYGMYPCHFLTYLRNIYSKDENQQVFQETIMPMLERVRMHPLLVTASKDKEISPERWRRCDVHDIVVDCAKLSLDLIEGTYEETKCPVIGTAYQNKHHVPKYPDLAHNTQLRPYPQITDQLNACGQVLAPKPLGAEDPHNKPIVSLTEASQFFSPTHVCSLSTPPPGESSQPGTAHTTPYSSVPESPLPSDPENRDKKKRLSGLSISLAGIIPGPVIGGSGNSVPPSPMKQEFTSEPPFSVYRMQAVRRIDFQAQQQQKGATKSPVARTSSLESQCQEVKGEDQGQASVKATLSEGSMERSSESLKSHASLLKQHTLGDPSPTSEVESCAVAVEQTQSLTDTHDVALATQTVAEESHNAAKLMTSPQLETRSQAATLTTQSSTESVDYTLAPERVQSQLSRDLAKSDAVKQLADPESQTEAADIQSVADSTDGAVKCSPKKESELKSVVSAGVRKSRSEEVGVSIPGKKLEHEQSHSVPSIYELPHFIESLGGTSEEADDEVSALTDSSPSSGMEPTDVNLTAESVQMFMKKVNRIRFNSMNIGSGEKIERHEKRKLLRANSCPHFEEALEEASDMQLAPALTGLSDSAVARTAATELNVVTTHTITSSVTMTTETKATIDSQTSCPNMGRTDSGTDVKVSLEHEDVDTMFPYTHMIPGALHVAPFMQCYTCTNAHQSSVHDTAHSTGAQLQSRHRTPPSRFNAPALGIETPYFSTLSPPEMLDRQLSLGLESHTALALERSKSDKPHCPPLVSGVDWSDDVTTLRGQILLLHNQLMYERHKRELYAKRTRRLLGRIVKTAALEERTAAMADQIGLQEDLIAKLKIDLGANEQRVKNMQQSKEQLEFHRDMTQRSCAQEIETLKSSQSSLTEELQRANANHQKLFKELQSSRAQVFDTEQALSVTQVQADFSIDLQAQIARLNKELLLMGELQQKYQQRLGAVSSAHNAKQENKFLLESYKHEVNKSKQSLQGVTMLYDANKARLTEADQTIKLKDSNIVELKNILEEVKKLHKCQTQALEDKYTTQRRVQQSLQGTILDLTAQLQLREKPTIGSGGLDDCGPVSSAVCALQAEHVTEMDQSQPDV